MFIGTYCTVHILPNSTVRKSRITVHDHDRATKADPRSSHTANRDSRPIAGLRNNDRIYLPALLQSEVEFHRSEDRLLMRMNLDITVILQTENSGEWCLTVKAVLQCQS